jgi:hypothetical protein
MIRLSSVNSPDHQCLDLIDERAMMDTPINTYKVNCEACSFPKIDTTPNPYFVSKKKLSGIEITQADLGNLLISDRVKQIFEILVPNQCTFLNTFIRDSTITTKWWLAIPNNQIINGEVKSNVKRCPVCNEPLYAHPGSQYKFWIEDIEAEFEIIKAKNWHSTDDKDWKRSWIGRDILISVRLLSLLKKVGAKGIYQYSASKFKKLRIDEKKWVENSLVKIDKFTTCEEFKLTKEAISNFKKHFSITDSENNKLFEIKFKTPINEIIEAVCNIKSGSKINIGFENTFEVEDLNNWQMTKSKHKLIAFATDSFGNELLFDPKDKNCSIYYYDHETMIYDLVNSSIVNIIG